MSTSTSISNKSGSDKTLVYLVRHGQTEWNKDRRFQGQLDVPLSAVGEEQAAAVAEWLARQPVRFSALYASDLSRAEQTAQAIAEKLHLRPQCVEQMREIHCGEWQGLSVDEVEERYPGQLDEWHEKVDCFTLPGGESIPLVQERIYSFYKTMVQEHRGEAIILVSHGAALAALLAAMHGWDLVETWKTRKGRLGNTAVSIVELDHGSRTHKLLGHNLTEHLASPTGMASVMDRQV